MPVDDGPPAGFMARRLPGETVPAGTLLYRMHRAEHAAIHFNRSADFRFNSANGEYGVLYAASTVEACFAETLLRQSGRDIVSEAEIRVRRVTEIELQRDMTVVPLHGSGLKRIGTTAETTSGPYTVSQAWSQAIHHHPASVDGIRYRSSRDNALFCFALFDRVANNAFRVRDSVVLTREPAFLGRILDRYAVGLV